MNLIVSYRKSLVKTGKPIVVSNGRSEIYTNKLILKNVNAKVIFNTGKYYGLVGHGTTTPLIIDLESGVAELIHDPIVIIDEVQKIPAKFFKAMKERERYRKLNPTQKRTRKPY